MTSRVFRVALCFDFHQRFDHQVAAGVIKFAKTRRDWRLSGRQRLERARDLGSWDGDGIIARIRSLEEAERLRELGVLLIDIAGAVASRDIASVVNDDHLTGFLAGRHLLGCGFGRLAFVGPRETVWSRLRLEGLRDAAAEGGAPDVVVFDFESDWAEGTGLPVAPAWLRALPLPCGLMAANDAIGHQTILAAEAAGLRLPEDLAVIGVDNEEVVCELSHPSLSSVPCDCERIGREAAEQLAVLMEGGKPPPPGIIPPFPIVARDSTDVIICKDALVRDVKRFIHSHAHRGINVYEVVAAFPYSRRTLELRFAASGEGKIHDEILKRRLEVACRHLESGKTVVQAAHASGFATSHHFHYVFRKFMRMTPLSYSRLYRRGRSDPKARADGVNILPPPSW